MRTPKRKVFIALAVIAFLAFLVVNSKNIASSGRTDVSDTVNLPLRAAHAASRGIAGIVPFASYRQENARLRGEIELLRRKLEELRPTAEENRLLREVLNFKKSVPFSTVAAEVIGRDPTNWSHSLIINKGLLHGIRQNKAVLSTKGLVGRVLEAGKYSSRILLITDPNSKVGVIIQRNRQGGMLVGRPGGTCKMIYIALDSDAAKGDVVMTAGLGSAFPKGVLVGRIVEVGREPGRLYKYAVVRPAQEMTMLEEVLCMQ